MPSIHSWPLSPTNSISPQTVFSSNEGHVNNNHQNETLNHGEFPHHYLLPIQQQYQQQFQQKYQKQQQQQQFSQQQNTKYYYPFQQQQQHHHHHHHQKQQQQYHHHHQKQHEKKPLLHLSQLTQKYVMQSHMDIDIEKYCENIGDWIVAYDNSEKKRMKISIYLLLSGSTPLQHFQSIRLIFGTVNSCNAFGDPKNTVEIPLKSFVQQFIPNSQFQQQTNMFNNSNLDGSWYLCTEYIHYEILPVKLRQYSSKSTDQKITDGEGACYISFFSGMYNHQPVQTVPQLIRRHLLFVSQKNVFLKMIETLQKMVFPNPLSDHLVDIFDDPCDIEEDIKGFNLSIPSNTYPSMKRKSRVKADKNSQERNLPCDIDEQEEPISSPQVEAKPAVTTADACRTSVTISGNEEYSLEDSQEMQSESHPQDESFLLDFFNYLESSNFQINKKLLPVIKVNDQNVIIVKNGDLLTFNLLLPPEVIAKKEDHQTEILVGCDVKFVLSYHMITRKKNKTTIDIKSVNESTFFMNQKSSSQIRFNKICLSPNAKQGVSVSFPVHIDYDRLDFKPKKSAKRKNDNPVMVSSVKIIYEYLHNNKVERKEMIIYSLVKLEHPKE